MALSPTLKGKALGLSVYDKELLALVLAIKKIEALSVKICVCDKDSSAKSQILNRTTNWDTITIEIDKKTSCI